MNYKYTKEIAIGILLAIILLMGWYGNRHLHTNSDIITPIEVVNIRQSIIDSINNIELIRLDSLKQVSDKRIEVYKRSAKRSYSNFEKQKAVSDSLMTLYGAKIDTICMEVVQSKQNEIDTLLNVVNSLGDEADAYSERVYLTEKMLGVTNKALDNKTIVNQRLNTEIIKLQKDVKRNWFERNAVWIGAICGSTATILIMK